MNNSELTKEADLLSKCFTRGMTNGLNFLEILFLNIVASYGNNRPDYASLSMKSGIADSALRHGSGAIKKLINRGLLKQGYEKRGSTRAFVFSLSDEGWSVLHVLRTGKIRKLKGEDNE